MKRLLVIHPFLFAIFPVLFLFARNIDEIPATDLLLPVLVLIAGTLILLFSSRFITKSYNKSGIITFFFLVLFFSYGHVNRLIQSLVMARLDIGELHISTQFVLGPLWALLFIVGAVLVIKAHRDFSNSTKFLNVVAITVVVISLINVGIYEINTTHWVPEKAHMPKETIEESASLTLDRPNSLRDIYYIILDTYTRQDILEEFCGYDNSEFINYLTSKGFYVATKSCSNYPATQYSLASSLNMDYLTAEELANPGTLNRMWKNSKVSRLLKERGYRYIYTGAGSLLKDMGTYADVGLTYKLGSMVRKSELVNYLLDTTALQPFTILYLQGFLNEGHRISTLYVFDKLADIPDIEEPTFTYGHIYIPHPPFVFDRNGNSPKRNLSDWIYKDYISSLDAQYVDQLIFTNKMVKTLVDEILSKSDVAPIIILQGDHGMYWGEERGRYILNAYYLPGKDSLPLYNNVSPVNSFRIIFNLYFDTDYKLLEDLYDALGTTR